MIFVWVRACFFVATVLVVSFSWAESDDQWRSGAKIELAEALKLAPNTSKAKNIILFVGDGMGVSTVTAARILEGQQRGRSGEENSLSFEKFPYLALAKTYSANSQTAQSSATMSAIITGVKTKDGLVSLSDRAVPGDCATQKNNEVKTFLESAEAFGLSTGIVSTARITHATPAATYAHSVSRSWENDARIPEGQKGCKDIAAQLLEFSYGDGLEVVLGGGRQGFLPQGLNDPEKINAQGLRKDKRDLTQVWLRRFANAAYVWNNKQLTELELDKIDHLLGLFSYSHMAYEYDRKDDVAGEPSLSEMTQVAISILSKNEKGFFLMVEAGRIDNAHHSGNAFRALGDTIELARAVEVAQENTDPKNTLIIVTADHSHVMTMAGYPTKGNPILGKVIENDAQGLPERHNALDLNSMPYTTLSYGNGPGALMQSHKLDKKFVCCRRVLLDVDTSKSDFYQEALVPLNTETHGGEDVAIYAQGPWAHLFRKTHEQHYIYYVMSFAAGLL